MKPLARIVQLSAAFLGSNFARAAIGLGLSLVLGRGLGADRFGRWMLCVTWASTLTVVTDLGFGVLLTRDGARADGEPGRLISGALVLRLAVALPLAAVLYVFASRLSSEPETIAGVRAAALLGSAGAAAANDGPYTSRIMGPASSRHPTATAPESASSARSSV